MFKIVAAIFALIACAAAKPHLVSVPLAYTAPAASVPVVAASAPVVTAASSQVIARNYNGIAKASVVAPVAAPLIAKTYISPNFAAAYATPYAYAAPIVAKYATAYSHPLAYSVPFAAAPSPVII